MPQMRNQENANPFMRAMNRTDLMKKKYSLAKSKNELEQPSID